MIEIIAAFVHPVDTIDQDVEVAYDDCVIGFMRMLEEVGCCACKVDVANLEDGNLVRHFYIGGCQSSHCRLPLLNVDFNRTISRLVDRDTY